MTPGLIETEMTEGKILSKEDKLEIYREIRDVSFLLYTMPYISLESFSLNPDQMIGYLQFQVHVSLMPLESAEKCTKAIVDSACRGEKYLTVPSWTEALALWKVFCPEIIDSLNWLLLMTH